MIHESLLSCHWSHHVTILVDLQNMTISCQSSQLFTHLHLSIMTHAGVVCAHVRVVTQFAWHYCNPFPPAQKAKQSYMVKHNGLGVELRTLA